MSQKELKIVENHAFWASWRPWGDPKTRATASFQEAKNAISLHLAAFFALKSAPNTVKHEVLGFAQTLKPRILHKQKHFFMSLTAKWRQKQLFVIILGALVRKTQKLEAKTRVLDPLNPQKRRKMRKSMLSLDVFSVVWLKKHGIYIVF